MTNAFTGKDLVVQWAYSSGTVNGTVNLETDYRTLSYTPDVEMHDQTAGSDAAKTYITGIVDGQISWGGLLQSADSTLKTALQEGVSGTLVISPEGTASGKAKITIPAISKGLKYNIQYNNLTEVTCDFQQNGNRTETTY